MDDISTNVHHVLGVPRVAQADHGGEECAESGL